MKSAGAHRARPRCIAIVAIALLLAACESVVTRPDALACARMAMDGARPIAGTRSVRFLGKVDADTARCRGGERTARSSDAPYVDWPGYWAAADADSLASGSTDGDPSAAGNARGIAGALLDLEYQRIELIKFNLFDNSGTYRTYVEGRDGVAGPALKVWDAMRLPPSHPSYGAVGGDGVQMCQGELIRFRNVDGTCNDIRNPRMGATKEAFARNVQFDSTFPELGRNALARNRHGDRLTHASPDPQRVSRELFTRIQSQPALCNAGQGLPGDSSAAHCDYQAAPTFNVLGAFWIQLMTHDWFSHRDDGRNVPAVDATPQPFTHDGSAYVDHAYRTSRNTVTAWWDASQLYGYDARSRQRVRRDPGDPARLMMVRTTGNARGYLPTFVAGDPIAPQWSGQEATAFPDNWTIGSSFFHNLFAREHNAFVDAFRGQAARTPNADCGLRNPGRPDAVIAYRDVTPDELFEIARLVVAAEIAKIHTTEWTPQLLYDEPLHRAANANWGGLLDRDDVVSSVLDSIVVRNFGTSASVARATAWYSAFASGPGIFGLGSHVYPDAVAAARRSPDVWSIANPDHVNGGVNHFGSPFNFPEEFVTVYRLHALVPDLIDYREWDRDPNAITHRIAIVTTAGAAATRAMRERGIANWALSMGRQRAGTLTLHNHPQFLQNLDMHGLAGEPGNIDVAARDIQRDRERGVPRFNEFRRQYGLKQFRRFDDFIDPRLPRSSPARDEQERNVATLRALYGQHRCDATKVITTAQLADDGGPIDDCLGFPDGTLVDNIEDVDTVVGWLAESRRPHGSAISETQLQVFILNASRRLFSDRFFTSSFRPEFYTSLGVRWVTENGPDGKLVERGKPNGHTVEVSPLKRVLLRNVPELNQALAPVVNAFDPWARDRGSYYSLQWKPRPEARSDAAFGE